MTQIPPCFPSKKKKNPPRLSQKELNNIVIIKKQQQQQQQQQCYHGFCNRLQRAPLASTQAVDAVALVQSTMFSIQVSLCY